MHACPHTHTHTHTHTHIKTTSSHKSRYAILRPLLHRPVTQRLKPPYPYFKEKDEMKLTAEAARTVSPPVRRDGDEKEGGMMKAGTEGGKKNEEGEEKPTQRQPSIRGCAFFKKQRTALRLPLSF